MEITISKQIKDLTPNFRVGVMIANVVVYEEQKIDLLIKDLEDTIAKTIRIEDVVNLEVIKDGRDAYKKYGKDPSRYRLATESLYRRLSKGNKLYRINNLVDLGNVISIKTKKSIAVLDYEKISGDILIRLGTSNDNYIGIGRGSLNIENIPLYEDKIGPFGSSTSDTPRTMIMAETRKLLLLIISFNGIETLHKELEDIKELYKTYAKASKITTFIV